MSFIPLTLRRLNNDVFKNSKAIKNKKSFKVELGDKGKNLSITTHVNNI